MMNPIWKSLYARHSGFIAMKILHIISSNDRLMPDTGITYYIYTVWMLNLRIPMNLP